MSVKVQIVNSMGEITEIQTKPESLIRRTVDGSPSVMITWHASDLIKEIKEYVAVESAWPDDSRVQVIKTLRYGQEDLFDGQVTAAGYAHDALMLEATQHQGS